MHIDKKLQYRLLQRNTRYSIIDGMFFCIYAGATIPYYIGLYILRLKGPAELVNLVLSFQPLVLATISFFGSSYANSFQKKKPLLMLPSLIMRLFIFFFVLIPFIPPAWRAWSFFGLWVLMYIPWGFISLSWSPLISNSIPEEQIGKFFGTRNALTGLATFVGTLFTGVILSKFQFELSFMVIFGVSFIFTMISLYFLNKQIEPVVPEEGESKLNIRTNNDPIFKLDLQANLSVFKDPQYGFIFGLSCLAIFIFHIGHSMAIPLFSLRQIQELNFSNATVGIIANVSGATALIGAYVSGRVTQRWGFQYLLLYSTLVLIVPPIIWAATTKLPLLIFASMLWEFARNAYMICFFYMVLAISPFKDRSRFVGMNTVVGNMAGCIGPILGIFFTRFQPVGIRGTLIVSSIIMLAGSGFSYLAVKKSAQ